MWNFWLEFNKEILILKNYKLWNVNLYAVLIEKKKKKQGKKSMKYEFALQTNVVGVFLLVCLIFTFSVKQ